jgi:glycosyltransferase involved in cell wall biosynthesis
VIVPARDAAATIGDTLRSLAAQDFDQPFEVIVVDDGSEDETAAIAERAGGNVRVLRRRSPTIGEARNAAAAEARGEVLAFTDADCEAVPGWLREGVEALAEADLVQGPVRMNPRHPWRAFDHTIEVEGETGLYETANLFLRRSLFERHGGFEHPVEARIGKPLGEDSWLGWRARRAGARTAFAERALVYHAVVPRGALRYVLDRRRLVYLPALVARMPELRATVLYRRFFSTRRAAAFDAAVAGLLAGGLGAWLWRPVAAVALLAAVPYAVITLRRGIRMRRHGPKVLLVDAAADGVGLAAALWGSLRYRRLVL